ncbi:MAG: orotidine-5'-phosphate decarboxylase [Actinomycetota bacterium]
MAHATDAPGPLCIALDGPDAAACERLADATEPFAGAFKLGLTSFSAGGRPLVEAIAARRPLFLDLKLHDIPAQVEGAARVAARLGASFVTAHASGGAEMMRAAVTGGGERTVVLAVTVLTSLSEEDLRTLGVPSSVEDQALRLAEVSLAAGAGGLVCSPREARALRDRFGARSAGGPLLVVPGIRGPGDAADDQQRTASGRAALEGGADLLVVGRSIAGASDVAAAARRLHEQLRSPAEASR